VGLRYWHGTLLATSSALAIIVATGQSAEAQCALNNNAGGSNNAGAVNCISYNNGVNNTGNIVNQGGGTITPTHTYAPTLPGTATGISVVGLHTTLTGNITNSGTITNTHGNWGISIGSGAYSGGLISSNGASLNGSITNIGTITAQTGIQIQRSTMSGSIVNATNANINSGVNVAISAAQASVGGGLTNNGTITGGFSVSESTVAGTVSNGGTINAPTAFVGLAVVNGGIVGGSVINSGNITAQDDAIEVFPNPNASGAILNQTIAGSIVNTSTGNLSALVGIALTATSNTSLNVVSGNIVNNGIITAGSSGISIVSSTVNGSVNNTGMISGSAGGIVLVNYTGGNAGQASVVGSVVNSGNITGTAAGFAGIMLAGGSVSQNIVNALGGTITANGGVGILLTNTISFSPNAGASTVGGSIINQGTINAATGIMVTGGSTVTGGITNSGNIAGSTSAIDVRGEGAATTINQQAGTIGGAILLSALGDTVNVTGGAINGNIVGQGATGTVNFAVGAGNGFSYSNSITGVNAVNINSGTLFDNNSITATTVNVNGGRLAPGLPGTIGTLSITGNLVFSTAATYLVMVTPGAASLTNVTGHATLAGTVQAVFAPGSYMSKNYTILTSTQPLTGTFAALNTTSMPANVTASLAYTANDVMLDLTATLGGGNAGLNVNQQNVANAINNFFNAGGALPPGFFNVLGLTGPALSNALTQLSGESATDSEKGAFVLMDQFLSLLLDPFVDGRSGSPGSSATGFAPEQQAAFPPDIALAYNSALRAPPQPASFNARWTAWGSTYGGYNKTDGNPTLGSNTVTAHTDGFAGGMDYHFSPDTLAGFALAGGGTSWGLVQGLGTGRSDALQAGVYGKTNSGPFYVAGALAFTNNWTTTNRIALGDQLNARFNAQSYGGRVEAGYRYAMPVGGAVIGATPYAAVQAQSFHTPSYSETDVTGGGFGLSYNAMNATDTRSELGARFDEASVVSNGLPLILRARAAWAHDWVSNPALGAVFETLPGASFTVNGAATPRNSALATVGAQLFVTPAVSIAAKLDGDFAGGSQTYAGTATVRYTW
jgi:uncharacterized protein with beta-barrel porin domain